METTSVEEMVEELRAECSPAVLAEIEEAAVKLAKRIIAANGYSLKDDADDWQIDEYNLVYDAVLKICRKCLLDGFPINEYSIYEIPYGDEDGVLYCWVHEKEWGFGENYNPNAHCIDFWCPRDFTVAVPLGIGYTPEEFPSIVNVARKTCAEAVYLAKEL